MPLLAWLYEKLRRRQAPRYLRKHSLPMLVWKPIRKWLSASVLPFVPFNSLRVWGYRLVGGARIGAYATVGACSMVKAPVPAFSLAVGTPARVVRTNVTPWGHHDAQIPQLTDRLREEQLERAPDRPDTPGPHD